MKPVLFIVFYLMVVPSVDAQLVNRDSAYFINEPIISIKSDRIARFTWGFIRAANPGITLINEGGRYQLGYTSQWSYMIDREGLWKLFGEYSYVESRFIPHIFHLGLLRDIVTYIDDGLVFKFRFGFTPGVGLFLDFRDYGISTEYTVWFELIDFTRIYARYRFNFWVSQPSIGFQDFAIGLAMPL